jgi:hypothetical protein
MKCKHALKFLRQSCVYFEGQLLMIDVYKCLNCDKYYIINTKTDGKISLNGLIGEEIDA